MSVSVVGFTRPLGCRVFLNTTGTKIQMESLEHRVGDSFETEIKLSMHHSEQALLGGVAEFLDNRIADREYLLVAYNGERFNG